MNTLHLKSKLFLTLFLLLAIPVTVLFTKESQDIIKKAQEIKSRERGKFSEIAQPQFKQGEVIVKFKDQGSQIKAKTSLNKTLDKEAINFSDLEDSSIPPSLKNINSKYKIEKIEKVFKGADTPKEELAKLKQKFSQQIAKGERKINEKELLKVDLSRTHKLTFDKNVPLEQIIQELSQNPDVEYAEPNYLFKTQLVPNDPYYLDHYPDNVGSRDPNWNPSYDYQWNLKKINMEQAWDISTGSNSVTVAVIDTGIDYTHPELGGCTLIQVNNNQCARIAPGYDFVNSDNDPMDDMGHGTHVAGIIGAVSNNGQGTAGIDWQAKIMPVKVLDLYSGTLNNVINGILYAANNNASIINMSLGFGPVRNIPQSLKDSLDYAYDLGVILIAAAGNENSEITKGYWPANYYKVISVSATDPSDLKASFSNYGMRIDITAPGVEIISLKGKETDMYCPPSCNQRIINNEYYRANGTSFSAPHVSGFAGLLKAKNPSFNPEEIRNLLRIGTDDIGEVGFDQYNGYGRINAAKTVALNNIIPPTAVITSPNYLTNVNGIVNVIGTAMSRDTVSYTLLIGSGLYPTVWSTSGISLINGGRSSVVNDTLGVLDTGNLAEGIYSIKLEAINSGGAVSEWRTALYVDRSLHDGFPFVTNGNTWSSPLITDLNADGANELIFASEDANLYVVDSRSQLLNGWPKTVSTGIYASPAVADINADGKKEIIVSSRGMLYAFDYLANLLWSVPTGNNYNSPIVGKFTQKLNLEIMVMSYNGALEIYNNQGQRLLSQQIFNSGQGLINQAVYDMDKDGIDEIFAAGVINYYLSVYVFKVVGNEGNYNLTTVKNFSELSMCTNYSELFMNSPTIGDIDNDGKMDLVMSCSTTSFLGAWDIESGTLKWSYSWDNIQKEPLKLYPYPFYSPVTIANIDDDSQKELVVQVGLVDSSWKQVNFGIVVFEHDGQIKQGWPFKNNATAAVAPPIVADLDNDRVNEIIAGEGSALEDVGSNVYALKADGSMVPGWPKITNGGVRSSAAIGDLDNDQKLEVAVGSTDYKLYVWDTEGNISKQNFDWPKFMHDEFNTGVYLDFSSSPTPTPSCSLGPSGDLNCNGRIDVFDLTLLLGNFGSTSFPTGDLNGNGRVDVFDLTILLGNFGRSG